MNTKHLLLFDKRSANTQSVVLLKTVKELNNTTKTLLVLDKTSDFSWKRTHAQSGYFFCFGVITEKKRKIYV